MFTHFLNIIVIISCTIGWNCAIQIKIRDKSLYRVVPENEEQLRSLQEFGSQNPDVIWWSGVGKIGDEVELLAVPEAMDNFRQSLQDAADLQVELVFPFVDIVMSTTPFEHKTDLEPSKVLVNATCTNQNSVRSGSEAAIRKIPGTDLWTGIYYTVKMPRFPQGFLTWTYEKDANNASFVQIDLKPHDLEHYRRGGKWEHDAQWIFKPTEDPAWFTWDNRVLSKGGFITGWSSKEFASGHRVVISRQNLTLLGIGGELRDVALWKPVQSQNKTQFKIINKSLPNGTVTWTEAKYSNHSHFIQIDKNNEHREHYLKEGKWYLDSLFEFIPAEEEIVLEGTIVECTSTPRISFPSKNSEFPISNYTLNNPSSVIYTQIVEHSTNKTLKVQLSVENGLKKLAGISGFCRLQNVFGELADTEFPYIANPGNFREFSLFYPRMVQASRIVQIPPYSSVHATVYLESYVDPNPGIGFTTTVEITGKMRSNVPLSGNYIQSYLTSEGETYEILEVKDDSVIVNLKGNYTGMSGFKAKIVIEEAKPRWIPQRCWLDSCVENSPSA